jgi:hypothetical protein
MSKIRSKRGNNKPRKKPTVASLAAKMRRLQERLEDVEDLLELRAAVERNAGKPGVPFTQVKKRDFRNNSEQMGQPIPMSEIRKKYNL